MPAVRGPKHAVFFPAEHAKHSGQPVADQSQSTQTRSITPPSRSKLVSIHGAKTNEEHYYHQSAREKLPGRWLLTCPIAHRSTYAASGIIAVLFAPAGNRLHTCMASRLHPSHHAATSGASKAYRWPAPSAVRHIASVKSPGMCGMHAMPCHDPAPAS